MTTSAIRRRIRYGGRDTLSNRQEDTSTWGKRSPILCGLNNAAVVTGVGPFFQSPGTKNPERLVDVRVQTDRPSIASRDVTAYVFATQVYNNNPQIKDGAGIRVTTPTVDQDTAFNGLFGILETGRGGITSREEFIIPAHGKSIHIGADSVRLSVVFDPARVGWAGAGLFQGQRAAGFEVNAGVASSNLLPDQVRQTYLATVGGTQQYPVPNFSRLFQFFTDTPQNYSYRWVDFKNGTIPNTPASGVPYVDAPQPIPIDAVRLEITQVAGNLGIPDPVLLWVRES